MKCVMKHSTKIDNMYMPLAMAFVSLYLTANVLGPKPLVIFQCTIPMGLTIFPLTYVIGSILTEVYGFWAARRVIWLALILNLFSAFAIQIAITLPHHPIWQDQQAYETVFALSSRIMMVSVFTFLIGEMINAFIVSKLKTKMQGRLFWVRGILGNWVGEGVETVLFIPLAFHHYPADFLWRMSICYVSFKYLYALCVIPMISPLVSWLKSHDKVKPQEV